MLTDFQYKLLLPPLLGGVIGYITNWIAIRMLFRPYKEYRLFGLKIPFTPGLLPSRRGEIAIKVGEVIAQELINETELKKSLEDPEFYQYYQNLWQSLKTSERENTTIRKALFALLGEPLASGLSIALKVRIEDLINRLPEIIDENDFGRKFSRLISPKNIDFLSFAGSKEVFEFILTALSQEETNNILIRIYQAKLEEFEKNETTLLDILGQDNYNSLRALIENNPEQVSKILQTLLLYESLPEFVLPIVQSLMKKHWSLSLLANMMSDESLLEFIQNQLHNSASDLQNNQEKAITHILKFSDEIASIPVHHLGLREGGFFSSGKINKFVHKGLEIISSLWSSDQDNPETISGGFIDPGLNVKKDDPEVEELDFSAFWQSLFLSLAEQKVLLTEGAFLFGRTILDKEMPVATLFANLPQKWQDDIFNALKSSIAKVLPSALKTLDIAKTVERRLNEFPLPQLEELTMSVVGRELRAITQLGALLGFLIGSLQWFLK